MGFIWVLFLKNNTQTDKMKPNENLKHGPVIIIPLSRLLGHNFPKPSSRLIPYPNFFCSEMYIILAARCIQILLKNFYALIFRIFMVQHPFRPRNYWAEAVPYSHKKHGAFHKNMVQKYGTLPKRTRMPHKITRKGSLSSL